jgi:hypothetical protein
MKIDRYAGWQFWRGVEPECFRHLESRDFQLIAENAHHFRIFDMRQVINAFQKELDHRKWLFLSKEGRKEQLDRIQALVDGGTDLHIALCGSGISRATFDRWSNLYRLHGIDGLTDRRKGNTGRPRKKVGVA